MKTDQQIRARSRRHYLLIQLAVYLLVSIIATTAKAESPGQPSPGDLDPLTQRYIQYGQLHGNATLLESGIDSFSAREYHSARTVFEALLFLDAQSVEAAYYLGKIAYESGNVNLAGKYFQQAHRMLPAQEVAEEGSPLKSVSAQTVVEPVQPPVQTERTGQMPPQWFSVTGKPLKTVGPSPAGPPVFVKILDPGLQLITKDGWMVPPSSRRGTDPIYELESGQKYRLQRTGSQQSSVPIYLGALGAVVAVLALAN